MMNKNFTKHHLLEYIQDYKQNGFLTEKTVNPLRYSPQTQIGSHSHDGNVCYVMSRNLRVEDNFALNLTKEKSKELSQGFSVIIFLEKDFNSTKEKSYFIEQNLKILKHNLEINKINYEYIYGTNDDLKKYLDKLSPKLVVTDFNPIDNKGKLFYDFDVIEVDSFNIVPAHYADEKQAYNAASLRRKIYTKIYDFLSEFPKVKFEKNDGYQKLEDFIQIKLQDYAKYKNDPVKNVVSQLSPYINRGFISSQRIALEVIKSDNSDENKEIFLEELVIRKELSDNFCLYSKNFKSFDSLPLWAKTSLNQHKNDIRMFIFSIEELENAKTKDALWNASQNQLRREGKIHGYMRMYWAKMIAQWSFCAQEAIDKAIYLNDKYAFDAPSANGYTGILWSIGGLHDRPFQDRLITGEIRTMTYNGAKGKFDIKKYIEKYCDTDS